MISGNPVPDTTPTYPDDTIQAYTPSWWVADTSAVISPGCLVWAFLPHVEQKPTALEPVARATPTDHKNINYRIIELDARTPPKAPQLPVAALPHAKGEVLAVYKAKRRPVLVLSHPSAEVSKKLTDSKWQRHRTVLVAPYYGGDQDGSRGGWRAELLAPIRRAVFPQFMWDRLPLGSVQESVLRFDEVQPLGFDPSAYVLTGFRLSEDALKIVYDWRTWFERGLIREKGDFQEFRNNIVPNLPP